MTYEVDMILARTEIDFRGELQLVGSTVEVGVRVGRIGRKSLDLEYRLLSGERVVAEARSVLVGFDFGHGRSAEIPERWLRRVGERAPAGSAAP
jgi:acyl-CoA thioesterase FadM